MWRNLKLGSKLLLGFGLVLGIFMLATSVTIGHISQAERGSRFLVDGSVPSMTLSESLERHAYELFLAMRMARYIESDNSFSEVRKSLEELQKVVNDIEALHRAQPGLQAMQYEADEVFPLYKSYMDIVGRTQTALAEKNAQYDAMIQSKKEMDVLVEKLDSALYSALDEPGPEPMQEGGQPYGAEKARLKQLRLSTEIDKDNLKLQLDLQKSIDGEDIGMMNATLDTLRSIQSKLQDLREMTTDPQHRETMEQILAAFLRYAENLKGFVEKFTALNDLHNTRSALTLKFTEHASAASDQGQAHVKTISADSVEQLRNSNILLIFSTAAALVMGILIALFISRSISKPLNTIVALAKRAGEGDLSIERKEFRYRGKDELGTLVEALSQMIETQEQSMRQIVGVADNLSSGAENLSSISQETNASMEKVKTSIDQISFLSESNGAALEECNAGVEEMSAGAETVAQSATDCAAFISQTTEVSNKAIQTVKNVIVGMHGVDANAKESENKTRQLVASVENVSSFVSVITGIADQTNLLALNAAIEAARAGEVGRGFAVVAEEVRKLAEESARAAQNVNGIIVELQNSAQESITSTTEAGRKLEETLRHTEQAQVELDGALNEMHKANDSIQNIAAVAEEQAASSKEVATAIDSATKSTMEMVETFANIHHSTEETVRAAHGVAEHAQSMSQHAQTLTDVLSRFILRSSSAGGNTLVPLG
ncbi:MAG: methyl-accepting chemotaxis protein [Synergistaceae bacterium]|jgi:methyl-accepting chemotaxis protein|nr:methyl-accepting chemotaxis protein [Synergistaceae bacterium]